MKVWQKCIAILLIGGFPASLALMHNKDASASKERGKVVQVKSETSNADLEHILQEKANELASTDMQIAAAKGEVMKHEAKRRELISALEELRTKVNQVINSARPVEQAQN